MILGNRDQRGRLSYRSYQHASTEDHRRGISTPET